MHIAVLKDSQEDRELLQGYIEDCCGRRRLACMVSTFDRASQFFRILVISWRKSDSIIWRGIKCCVSKER